MRIYLIGPIGVGKSYILEELAKQGYPVFSDPIIDQNLLNTGTPYEVQFNITCSFLVRELGNKNGIFDTSLLSASYFRQLMYDKDQLTQEENKNLVDLELLIYNILKNTNNKYIFIKKSKDEIKQQIIQRGREYEMTDPFWNEINDVLLNDFLNNEYIMRNNDVEIIELKGKDISPVINRIKELIGNE